LACFLNQLMLNICIMKTLIICCALVSILFACSREKGTYVDLSTGKAVELKKDSTGQWVNASTGEPVYLYVDTHKHDTIYGKTGEVVNGHITKTDGGYVYDKEEVIINKEQPQEQDMKIKTEDKKIKVEDGEKKVKYD
jgi:hypothetical protein